jgi:hypothetical protein
MLALGVDDALAILDLVVGTNLNSKKVKVIKSKNNHKYKPAPKKPEDIKGIPLGFCCCCLLNCHHHSFLRRIQYNR